MRTYHWNGEHWYQSNRSLWKRVRRWFVWVGGWETADDRWRFRIPGAQPPPDVMATLPREVRHRLKRWIWMDPTPISLLGHRFTYYGWGFQLSVPGGWLVYTRKRYGDGRRTLYISRNGTPSQAHCWIIGTPREVLDAAAAHQIERELRKASRAA